MIKPIDEAPPSMIISELSKLFNDQMRRKTAALGMADGWRRIFFHLSRQPHLSQLELVHRTHLSAPAVSVALQKMEAAGLVERRTDAEDLRAVQVCLTPKGVEANRRIGGAIREAEQEMLRGISAEEIETIRPILKKMYQNLIRIQEEAL